MAYDDHNWKTGDDITAGRLNNMEQGIKTEDNRLGNLEDRATQIETEASGVAQTLIEQSRDIAGVKSALDALERRVEALEE